MKKLLLSALTLAFACGIAKGQDITGDWYGNLETGVQKLPLVLHISRAGDGYVTVLDSPDQNATGLSTTSTTFDGEAVRIVADGMMMTWEGVLENGTMKGTFRQRGASFPLEFTRQSIVRTRPQTPQPPYPYVAEDVTFANPAAGITLAGTLTLPQGTGTFPAAVLITGSGAQNRDEEILGHKPFLVLADYLSRNGIAVLRYDDRGTGASSGDYASAAIEDFATDAEAALEYLKSHPGIDASRIGFIGHSEGGIITYMLAGTRGDIAFIVSMAGPAVKGADFMREQRRLIISAMGMPEEAFRQNERMVDYMIELTDKYPYEYIFENVDSLAASLLPAFLRSDPRTLEQTKTGLIQSAMPEMVSMRRYDPARDLSRITCPVLAVVGEKDLQVPPSVVEIPLRERINPDTSLEVKVYPELNHLFQHAVTGMPSEYGDIEETISPEVLADITVWIKSAVE